MGGCVCGGEGDVPVVGGSSLGSRLWVGYASVLLEEFRPLARQSGAANEESVLEFCQSCFVYWQSIVSSCQSAFSNWSSAFSCCQSVFSNWSSAFSCWSSAFSNWQSSISCCQSLSSNWSSAFSCWSRAVSHCLCGFLSCSPARPRLPRAWPWC